MELPPGQRLRMAALRYAAAFNPCPVHSKHNCCAMARACFNADELRDAGRELEAAATAYAVLHSSDAT